MSDQIATPQDIERLLGTPSEEDIAEQAQRLRLHRSRARLSPEERVIARGVELETHHRQTGDKEGLAEALAMQGKFQDAATLSADAVRKAEYTEKAEAVEKPDVDCECDSFIETSGYALPAQYVEFEAYVPKYGQTMPFIRCTKCGDLNARPLPQHLAAAQAIRHDPEATDKAREDFFKI